MKLLILPLLLISYSLIGQPTINWNKYFNLPAKSCTAIDYKLDLSGGISVAINIEDSMNSDFKPGLIKYDQAGNFIWQWISSDTMNSVAVQLEIDHYNNLYLLTFREDYRQNHLIKIDANTGQELFNIEFDTSLYTGKFTLDSLNIYVVQSAPDLLTSRFDLTGNLLSTFNLDYIQQIRYARLINNNLILIGDSFPANMLVMHAIDTTGNYLKKQYSNITSPNCHDIDIVGDSLIFVSGDVDLIACPFIIKFNLVSNVWDTLPCFVNGSLVGKSKIQSIGAKIYWGYQYLQTNGGFISMNYLSQVGSNSLFTLDSSRNSYLDLDVDSSEIIYTLSTNRGSGSPLLYDYEVNAYDPLNSINIWSLRYSTSNNSQDAPCFIKYSSNSLYIIGNIKDNYPSGLSQVNVMKLNQVTGSQANIAQVNNTIYPNPNYDRILHINDIEKDATIDIYNSENRVVFHKTNFNINSIDIKNLESGLYIVKITSPKWTKTHRLIVY